MTLPTPSKRVGLALVAGLLIALAGGDAALAAAQTITYTYDALGRVVTVNYGNGVTVTYTYDKAGNRTARVAT